MKFSLVVLASLLSASEVLAAPGSALRQAKNQRRATRTRGSRPFIPANVTGTQNAPSAQQSTDYSTNWAGAALVGSGYTGVTGTFTVPSVKLPSGGNSGTAYSASAWVGLDGYTCESAILQTGVDFTLQDGQTSYDAWYEWYPADSVDFSGITFSAGDSVKLTIVATSTSSGTATIENITKGKTVSHTFSSQSDKLCETNAEWIVEDFEEIDGGQAEQVPFVDFEKVTFTSAQATKSGSSVSTSGADIVDMTSSNGDSTIASASASGNTVTVTYE
ncbi:MAG: hypothetical protein M1821_006328 [Bathelium mastoideum]|nr:MAG: hypothetical protein M1821_006328 [Bathelium mastoideum]KAI9693607.1 MAG: hypothetical protein M1822_002878 [Bathelium mastoideum]